MTGLLRILNANDPETERLLDREFSFPEDAARTVENIIARVRAEGDAALCTLTAEYDKVELSPEGLAVREEEIEAAYGAVSARFVAAIRLARDRISGFHSRKLPATWMDTAPDGTRLGQLIRPLASAGVYVPGGRARYPSSVLMNVVPARVAGVRRVVMTTPPGPQGGIDPHVLVAAREAGVDEVYRIGGAQAVAALAYGTKAVPRVDKIVGPGNVYVTLAKRAVFGLVGIDSLAGPSEVLVIADDTADPRHVAADLLAQAEHDPLARAFLITTNRALAFRVNEVLEEELTALGRPETVRRALGSSAAVIVPDVAAAVDYANRFAPEHLELMVAEPMSALEKVENAGGVFLGRFSPVPMGDYIAGPNHVLPTGGTARFFSPLGVEDFLKRINVVGLSPEAFKELAGPAFLLASVEGLPAHGRAIKIREK
ncbi:MAG: histidinol dehydrogenase [Bacillota bacterium]